MKTYSFRTTISILALAFLPAVTHALDTGVSCIVYATPDKPYLEINIEIAAASVTYKPVDSTHLQAAVEILLLLKQGETVVNYEKYVLNSPLVLDPQSLLDVKRLAVAPGEYVVEISFQDQNTAANKDFFTTPVKVDLGMGIYLSDAMLLRSFHKDNSGSPFTKNGFYLEPLPFNFYDRNATTLSYYAEIYHANLSIQDNDYLVRYIIEQDLGNGTMQFTAAGSKHKKPSAIDALLVQMDISKLESGNYRLTIELRNKQNELLTQRQINFQRSNPYLHLVESELTPEALQKQFVQQLTEDNLRYSLRAISPIIDKSDNEILKNILQSDSLEAMRFFLFRHYVRLDPNNPEGAYRKYMELAGIVDQKFYGGFRRGFETDRGRMYLRYGKPDDLIHVEDDPSAAPYEIWVYYNFPKTKQTNVKFLFYNPSLAGEDFILLHSNARGETNNPKWERELYKRNAGEQYDGDNYQDATSMQRNTARNARVYFEDF